MKPEHSDDAGERERLLLLGQRFERLQAEIEEYRETGEYELAISLCVEIVRHNEPQLKPYIAWAKEELSAIRKLPEKLRSLDAAALRMAGQLMELGDFEGAIGILDDIPASRRSRDHDETLEEARHCQHQISVLEERLQQADRRSNLRDMEKYAEQILAISRGHSASLAALREVEAAGGFLRSLGFKTYGGEIRTVLKFAFYVLLLLAVLIPVVWLLIHAPEITSTAPR